ncbi:MAG: hypothetical protein Q4B35_01765 [Slackia sp.]|nr:hypothetical protein [Slackia sp.]
MAMKVCPVCSARCFDDMSVCYGCLHDFSREPEESPACVLDSAAVPTCGDPCIEDDAASIGFDESIDPDEPPDRMTVQKAPSRVSDDPPWFDLPCPFADDVREDSLDSRECSKADCSFEGQGRSAAPESMAIPMLTVVRSPRANARVSSDVDGGQASFVVRIPAGTRLVVQAVP